MILASYISIYLVWLFSIQTVLGHKTVVAFVKVKSADNMLCKLCVLRTMPERWKMESNINITIIPTMRKLTRGKDKVKGRK